MFDNLKIDVFLESLRCFHNTDTVNDENHACTIFKIIFLNVSKLVILHLKSFHQCSTIWLSISFSDLSWIRAI